MTSKEASDASYTLSIVPPGQIWVESSETGQGDVEGAARSVARVPGIGAPVVLRNPSYRAGRLDKTDTAATFATTPKEGNYNGTIMVLDRAEDLERVVGETLPEEASQVLMAGGVLDFTRTAGDQRLVVASARGKRLSETPLLRTMQVRLDAQLRQSFGGAILRSTAEALDLPVKGPDKVIYPGVTATDIEQAAAAVVDAGYDADFVQYSVPPPEPVLPKNAYVFLASLLVVGAVVVLIVIRGQARRLRAYGSRLLAVGLGPRWALRLLLGQASLTVGIGLLAGVLGGVAGVFATSQNYAVISVPVPFVASACVATIMLAIMATWIAGRALAADDDVEVT